MAEATAEIGQRTAPMLSYEDVGGGRVAGAGVRVPRDGRRYVDPDRRVIHAEVELEGGLVTLGWPGPDYRSPDHHARVCEAARRWAGGSLRGGRGPGPRRGRRRPL